MKKRKRKYRLVRYGSKQKINDSPIKYNGTKLVVLSVLSLVMGAFLEYLCMGFIKNRAKKRKWIVIGFLLR
ncbi:MAG: hypothetical protein IJF07_01715 [Lachnospiraceae bacterium]|nr:hypothetical protein [Lachnospiraceae bacterium]